MPPLRALIIPVANLDIALVSPLAKPNYKFKCVPGHVHCLINCATAVAALCIPRHPSMLAMRLYSVWQSLYAEAVGHLAQFS